MTLAAYTYDNLGRMQTRKLHGSATNQLTYSYNVRDWLTGITGTKFNQNLYYNTGSGTACYNGNISSMTWKAGNETTQRGYKFAYDGLNRLTSVTYGEGTSISSNANRFTEKVTSYDKNGNIKGLQRYGQTSASAYGLIDNLTYTLDGNRPTRVDDAISTVAYNNGFEFKDAVKQANEYAYDANGNLTKDLNRNISNIEYNYLNLPSKVTFSDGSTITYTYAADGTKLRVVYNMDGTTTTTDYCGNVIYENGVRKYLLTDEGYVALNESNKYYYYLKDHQGNNRVVIASDGTVEETNHYYPFGGLFANSSSVQPYKYNGKEYDDAKGLNWYDYGARMYDPVLGRFTTQDRFAEKYPAMSLYQYGANNPICNIDINGDSIWFTPQYHNNQLEKLTMHVTGKVLNDSPNNVNMDFATSSISKAIGRTYQGDMDGITFETDVQLSVAESMNDVADSDHLFVLTDKIIHPLRKTVYGVSNYMGGKVAFIDADYFTGLYDRLLGSRNYGSFTAAHEFGHLLNLNHDDRNPFNVMRSNGMFYGIRSSQLRQIYGNWSSGTLNYGSNYFVTPLGQKRPNVGIMQRFISPY